MVAVAVLVRIRLVLRERRLAWFLVLEAAVFGVVAGHLLADRFIVAALNVGGSLALAAAWWWTGRIRRS